MVVWLGEHLEALLLLYWSLASLASTVALLPVPGASAFRAAVQLSACRGKLLDSKSPRALGPLSGWTVPQRWFAHFYALGAVWNAAVAYVLLSLPGFGGLPAAQRATSILALSLLQLHLTRRLVETVGLMKYPPGSRMHGIAYLFGMSYYLLVSPSVLPAAVYPALLAHGAALLSHPGASWPSPLLPSLEWLAGHLAPVQLLGGAVFVAGNLLQWHSHWLLARLSRAGSKAGYKIPRGGAFQLVSCPHYLGEVVLYAGLVAATAGRRATAWLMLLWVVSNLSLAAGMTHRWYRARFKSYPRSRRALFPCVY